MTNLTLIPTEKLESLQADLDEIKSLLFKQSKQDDFNKWLSKKEARIRLKVCQKTLDNYLSKGIIPYSRFGGKTYIKASDIEAHLERNFVSS
jgi:hypothetical protein